MSHAPDDALLNGKIDASELALAHFGECRLIHGDLIDIFSLACSYNEGLATGKKLLSAGPKDMPIATIHAAVPQGRWQHLLPLPRPPIVPTGSIPRLQPCLLVEHPHGLVLADGLDRLNQLILLGASHVPSVTISWDECKEHGQVFEKFDDPPSGHRTLQQTRPPAPGSQTARRKVDETGPVTSHTHKASGDNQPPTSLSLLMPAPTVARIEGGRLILKFNSFKKAEQSVTALANQDEELEKAIDILPRKVPGDFSSTGAAGFSLQELTLILFINLLLKFIGDLVGNGKAGRTIIAGLKNYRRWPGAQRDLIERMRTWRKFKADKCRHFSKPIPEDLFDLGVNWTTGRERPCPKRRIGHAIRLARETFKAHYLAQLIKKNLRELSAINTPNARPNTTWQDILARAADGTGNAINSRSYSVDVRYRMLLALHGRLNPAKIWRETARDTLMYQWLIAIGDLNRTGQMIVTCLMAQELVQADYRRSVRPSRGFGPDWTLFDRALALAVTGKTHTSTVHPELLDLCWKAMQGSYAQIVSLSDGVDCCFESKQLSPEASKLVELPIMLT